MDRLDVQSRPAELRFKLTRVGVTGVKKPVHVRRPDREVTLTANLDVFVDLPATMKGSHLSRNLEVVSEIVEESVQDPVPSLEALCADIAHRLLERHDYASYGEVDAWADYFLGRTTPRGKRTTERYRLTARARADRGSPVRVERSVGVEVSGMTACPCAMETIKHHLAQEGKVTDPDLPIITHNQRTLATVTIDVPAGREVEANDLIDLAEESLSSPTYEILKRGDEADVVERAHRHPRFVEDVVREILARLLKAFPDFPDGVQVWVRAESEESIHKHNAVAERITTLGELRR